MEWGCVMYTDVDLCDILISNAKKCAYNEDNIIKLNITDTTNSIGVYVDSEWEEFRIYNIKRHINAKKICNYMKENYVYENENLCLKSNTVPFLEIFGQTIQPVFINCIIFGSNDSLSWYKNTPDFNKNEIIYI